MILGPPGKPRRVPCSMSPWLVSETLDAKAAKLGLKSNCGAREGDEGHKEGPGRGEGRKRCRNGGVGVAWGLCGSDSSSSRPRLHRDGGKKKKPVQSDGRGGISGHKPPHVEVGEKGTVETEGFGERVVSAGANGTQRCCAYADCHDVFINLPA